MLLLGRKVETFHGLVHVHAVGLSNLDHGQG